GNFSAATSFSILVSPKQVAIGDFDGDGNQDLAVASSNSGDNVSILLGDGMGNFSAPTRFGASANSEPMSVAVGDFNGDGKQDLAFANSFGTVQNVSILLRDCGARSEERRVGKEWSTGVGACRGKERD